MSEQTTPSQAEGERDDDVTYEPPRTTPSQAEGERDDDEAMTATETPGPDQDRSDAYARARDEDEPGAHSGQESQARERVLPGTASAAEGYGSYGGTADGDPLSGIEEGADDGRTGD
ncbi:hypothetical protein ACWC10_03960 [Streptomyces sp. NPDC001595]|uniref:hypothetical protein n=1 Tax=Streptomyces sp. NPDC001532 TaxID=3154520 RepID=UPI00332C58F7